MRVFITKLLGAEHCIRDMPNCCPPYFLFIIQSSGFHCKKILKIISCLSHSSSTEQTGNFFLPNSPTRISVSLVVKFSKSTGISLKIYCEVEVRSGVADSWPLLDPLDLSAEVFPQRIPFMGSIF